MPSPLSWGIGRAATLLKTLLQYYGKSLEALPGVAYPGFRDNRSTLNTKTGYKNKFKNVTQWDCVVRIVVVTCTFDVCTESVQQSLEKKFGKAGGTIPITPSDLFEKRMGVSTNTTTHLYLIHCQSVALLSVLFCPQL